MMTIPSVERRREKLSQLLDTVRTHENEIEEALRRDLGKCGFEIYATESGFITEEIRFVLRNLKKWTQTKRVATPLAFMPGKSFIVPQPYGHVLIIAPWNYPYQLAMSPLIGAIAAGNRVTLKPSEFSPETSKVLRKILTQVFESSEVEIVEGGVQETKALLEKKFDYIFFTGSTPVGRSVMLKAAETLTPVTLELGGKSPLIVHESADLHKAAKRCVWGKFTNVGQTCVAPDYVLVPRQMQEKFIELLRFYIVQFYGAQSATSPDYGRIINERHFQRLINLIDRSKLVIGGETNAEKKFISPTVFRDVRWEDPLMQDEIFGPLLPIVPYDNIHDVLRTVESRPKPLALYVFSENSAFTQEVLTRQSFGGGCVNDVLVHLGNPHLPFGGVGGSGMGSYHGQRSFETFSHYKGIYQRAGWMDIPVRYPPYEGKMRWLKLFLG